MMKNILLVGYGNIGKKHEAAISRVENLQISSIVDPLAPVQLEHHVYPDLKKYFDHHSDTDLASICTPNDLHAKQAIACMRDGLDVLIEKPMALTKASAEQIIATALKTNRKVFCVMQLRYSPVIGWLKHMLDKNLLGDIYSIEVRCFWNRNESYYRPGGDVHPWRGSLEKDKGPLYTQFSHFVDLVYYLFGAWKVNHASFNNFSHMHTTEFEDSGHVLFNAGKTAGIFSYTTSVFEKNYESTVTIIGSKGTVSIGGQYFNQVRYAHPATLPEIDKAELIAYNENKLAGHIAMYQNVIDVLDSDESITTNAMDGLKVVEMIEEVYKYRK